MTNNIQHPRINLLLTRPQAGSDAFWNALPPQTRSFLNPIRSPLIEIVPLTSDTLNVSSAIFTSVNGVQNAPKGQGRNAYCVGATTTAEALIFGWNAVQKGETAEQLLKSLKENEIVGPFTHLAGTHTRGEIAKRLTELGMPAQYIPVYDQQLRALTQQAVEALTSNFPLLVPLFSPRTAIAFMDQITGRAPLYVVALSPDIADILGDQSRVRLTIAKRPTRLAMIEAVEKVATQLALG